MVCLCWKLIIGTWILLAVGVVWFQHKILTKKLLYLSHMDPQVQVKYRGTERYDFANIVHWKTYLGGALLVPPRLVLSIPFLLVLFVLVYIPKLLFGVDVKTGQTPRGKFYINWQVGVFVLMRPLLLCLGITKLKKVKVSIKDFIADYKSSKPANSVAPIVVSNHVSILDMFYYLTKNVSFLSKDTVAKSPFVGMFAVARQNIFLDRTSLEDRERVLQLIKTRAARVNSHGDISPLLIFPEGTVSNGRSLIGFKKGAFQSGDLIKIYMLKYNPEPGSYAFTMSNMSTLYSVILSMSQLTNTIEEIEFLEPFDPEYIYQRDQIDRNHEDAWKHVAAAVKNLMAQVSGFQSVETSMRETKEFEKVSADINSQVLESQKRAKDD